MKEYFMWKYNTSSNNLSVFAMVSLLLLVIVILFVCKKINSETDNSFEKISDVKEKLSTNAKHAPTTVILSKEALDKLIKKAADQKYLQDALSDGDKLPTLNQKPIKLVDLSPNIGAANISTDIISSNKNQAAIPTLADVEKANAQQHCFYQDESYSIGEIVNSDKGWLRCTPSFTIDKDGHSYYGSAVWILRDRLV